MKRLHFSTLKAIWLIVILLFVQFTHAQINSQQSGNWNDPATWVGAVVPGSTDNVVISSGHTVNVNTAAAACNNLSFGDNTARLNMSTAASVLNVYGNFTAFSTTHTVFSAWTGGAKIKFTGATATQTISGYPANSAPAFSFMEMVVDKSSGIVTTDATGMRLGLGTSLEIINGTFQLAASDDIEGRNLTGGTTGGPYKPTITVQAGALFNMAVVNSHIRSGALSTDDGSKIGKMTIYGTVSFSAGQSNRINLDNVDIESGGTLEMRNGGSVAQCFNPGRITVKSGAVFRSSNNTNSYWFTNATTPSELIIESGGELDINGSSNSNILPQALTLSPGSWVRYSASATALSSDSRLASYYNLRLVGSAKTLQQNTSVADTLSMRTSASAAPSLSLNGFGLVYGSAATLEYRGIGSPPPAQTTADTEWPQSGNRPFNVQIYSKTDVILNNDKDIDGSLIFKGATDTSSKILLGVFNLKAGNTSGSDSVKYAKTNSTGKLTLKSVGAVPKVLAIGNSTYNPLTLSNGSNLDWSANVEDAVFVTQSPFNLNSPYAVQRTWNISPSVNPPPAGASITFQYNQVTDVVNGNFATTEPVQVWHKEATYWLAAGVSQVPGVLTGNFRTAAITGWTTFSPFAISTWNRPLPIGLISFDVRTAASGMLLQWTMADETGIRDFEVQRSFNGITFLPLGHLEAGRFRYRFTDTRPLNGKNYYRLKIRQYNGSFEYSAAVLAEKNGFGNIRLYPSPAKNQLIIHTGKTEAFGWTIYNASGQPVQTGAGISGGIIDISRLPGGFYIIRAAGMNMQFIKE